MGGGHSGHKKICDLLTIEKVDASQLITNIKTDVSDHNLLVERKDLKTTLGKYGLSEILIQKIETALFMEENKCEDIAFYIGNGTASLKGVFGWARKVGTTMLNVQLAIGVATGKLIQQYSLEIGHSKQKGGHGHHKGGYGGHIVAQKSRYLTQGEISLIQQALKLELKEAMVPVLDQFT